jgi:hypothetical protein
MCLCVCYCVGGRALSLHSAWLRGGQPESLGMWERGWADGEERRCSRYLGVCLSLSVSGSLCVTLCVTVSLSVSRSVSQFNSRAFLAWETCVNIAKASEVDNI